MDDAQTAGDHPPMLRVLASGSGGNCSVLIYHHGGRRRAVLIDAGLSPRRTRGLLGRCGLDRFDAVILTHLDSDHWRPNWAADLRLIESGAPVFMHTTHARWADANGLFPPSCRRIGESFSPAPGLEAHPLLMPHDTLGVAAYRFTLPGGASLGFATDVGRATDGLIEHLRGVDVLAIESNYCPRMQAASDRPYFLKRRIMGGNGHLSNQQAADAVAEIAPRDHTVFLHLSRQCNHPELVAQLHDHADYARTITDQHVPTRWVRIGAGRPQPPLWSVPAAAPAPAHAPDPVLFPTKRTVRR
jgi:phosphoribosyl 1,2-cyclic phosphodiesterase